MPIPNPSPTQAKFAAFMEGAKTLPPPQVNSMWVWIWEDKEQATKGFRFMGQRFTLDAYVFGQVIWRKVGTMNKPRGLPKGLDFFAAHGFRGSLQHPEGNGREPVRQLRHPDDQGPPGNRRPWEPIRGRRTCTGPGCTASSR